MKAGIIAATFCCLIIIGLPVPIASIWIGVRDRDDSCQTTDSIGLELHEWLLGAGIAGLGFFIIVLVQLIMTLLLVDDDLNNISMSTFMRGGITGTSISLASSIFAIVYSIIGGIVLFRSNLECLEDGGTTLGILSLVVILLYWIGIIRTCCDSNNEYRSRQNT